MDQLLDQRQSNKNFLNVLKNKCDFLSINNFKLVKNFSKTISMYFPLLSEDIWGVITKFGVSQNLEFLFIGSSEKTSKIAPEISFFFNFFS